MPISLNSDRGFTLLEVIVAFALLSLVLGSALAAISGGLKTQARTGEALRQLSLVQSTVARLGHDLPFESTKLVDPTSGVVIAIDVSPYQPTIGAWEALGTAPWRVRVEVTSADGTLALETLRDGPLP